MKKLLALLLVLLMCFMLVACGNSVNAYVRKNGEDLAADFEDSYSQSGLFQQIKMKSFMISNLKISTISHLLRKTIYRWHF